jgi:hypothetical protein
MPGSHCMQMAERAGFEPAVGLPPHTLSKRAPSASRTPLQIHRNAVKETGGEEGIRTLGPRERSTVFETAPIDHSGTSPRSGLVFYDDCRCLAKKRRSSSRDLCASRPPRWASGGPRRGSVARSITDPKAPARSSSAPQMTSWSRASRHAAAHIGQGSRVT